MKATALFAAAGFAVLLVTPANAQATRTWVSGVGDDANPCSRTAPCKTFAGAISKTAAGGEINCLDPAGFGTLTVTKSITVDCTGTLGGVLSAGVPGFTINAGANDKVVLRGIEINGAGTGTVGVRFLAGREVRLQNVSMIGINGNGVDVTTAADSVLSLNNVTMSRVTKGIRIAPTAGFAVTVGDHVNITGATTAGVELATNGAVATINRSVVSGMFPTGGTAFLISGGAGTLMVANSVVANNGTAFSSASAGSTIQISNNDVKDNGTSLNLGLGTIATAANNRIIPNTAVNPNGTIQVK